MDSLFQTAERCLSLTDPEDKVQATFRAAEAWVAGRLTLEEGPPPAPIGVPGRPERPRLVPPRELPKRAIGSEEGFAAFLHALTHIEFNAINLAWDAVYRFRGLPRDFYDDWVRVAREEAEHFKMLADHLQGLGYPYGHFDAHDGLWQAAVDTVHDPLWRMAIVPRGLEARGLDAGPRLLEKIRARGDETALAIMTRIVAEEEGHVAVGTRWFRYLCERRGLDPLATFARIHESFGRRPQPPFNLAARRRAGFAEDELAWLQGHGA